MGVLVVVDEQLIRATPEAIFEVFGHEAAAGWFFGADCDTLVPGAVVRFELPMGPGAGGLLQGTGRIVTLEPPHRIVVEHESPWRGQVTCSIARIGVSLRSARKVRNCASAKTNASSGGL